MSYLKSRRTWWKSAAGNYLIVHTRIYRFFFQDCVRIQVCICLCTLVVSTWLFNQISVETFFVVMPYIFLFNWYWPQNFTLLMTTIKNLFTYYRQCGVAWAKMRVVSRTHFVYLPYYSCSSANRTLQFWSPRRRMTGRSLFDPEANSTRHIPD